MSPRLEQLGFVGVLVACIVCSAVAFAGHRATLAVPRRIALGVGAFAVAGAVLRLVFVEPAFVHTNFHGPALVEAILSFPAADVHRAEYGPGSFVVLGSIAALVGRSAETVFRANAVLASLTTVPLAFVAARWAGRPQAAVYAAAAWATSPLVARLACSEDAHVLATFFALSALASMELACALSSRRFLATAIVTTLAAILTRQTLYPWPFFLVALLVERKLRGRTRLGTAAIAAAGAAMVLPTIGLSLATLGMSSNEILLVAWRVTLARPGLAFAMAKSHPLLSVRELSPLVTIFGAVGLASVARRREASVAVIVSCTVMALATLPMGLPSHGVSWSFRFPLYALALVLAGAGVSSLESRLARRPGLASHLLPSFALGTAILGALGAATLDNRKASAELAEYRAFREVLASIPRPFAVVSAGVHDPAPAEKLTRAMAARLGLQSVEAGDAPPSGSWVFLEGLGCHAYSVIELLAEGRPVGDEDAMRIALAVLDPRQDFGAQRVRKPSSMRPECRDLEAKLTAAARAPTVRDGPELSVEDDPPMALFDSPRVRLRIFTVQSGGDAPASSRR